ncbi:uracil-DNA glycosylase [Anaeramoeba flamelloides]|uniref:Uracil-DNA glycosylase n=1 Tax=Anaeramoeba flamelloides TaxID=1746091 RepID=A0ABQ8YR98_9EUKA|nr:uracil-DNA glycosylase [Anaeramoeba flamelloides]
MNNELLEKLFPSEWKEYWFLRSQKRYIDRIVKRLNECQRKKHTIAPKISKIFQAFKYCVPSKLKCIITASEPDVISKMSDGLALSVPFGVRVPIVTSKIFSILSKEIPKFKCPSHGDLRSLAKEGVLLLNTSLTDRSTSFDRNGNIWLPLISRILRKIVKTIKNLPILVIGTEPKHEISLLKVSRNNLIFMPSPLGLDGKEYWEKRKVFTKINEAVVRNGNEKINWLVLNRNNLNHAPNSKTNQKGGTVSKRNSNSPQNDSKNRNDFDRSNGKTINKTKIQNNTQNDNQTLSVGVGVDVGVGVGVNVNEKKIDYANEFNIDSDFDSEIEELSFKESKNFDYNWQNNHFNFRKRKEPGFLLNVDDNTKKRKRQLKSYLKFIIHPSWLNFLPDSFQFLELLNSNKNTKNTNNAKKTTRKKKIKKLKRKKKSNFHDQSSDSSSSSRTGTSGSTSSDYDSNTDSDSDDDSNDQFFEQFSNCTFHNLKIVMFNLNYNRNDYQKKKFKITPNINTISKILNIKIPNWKEKESEKIRHWSQQGILLLNFWPNNLFKNIWNPNKRQNFVQNLIKKLWKMKRYLVFVSFDKTDQEKLNLGKNVNNHYYMKFPYGNPLKMPTNSCEILFDKTNIFLKKYYTKTININSGGSSGSGSGSGGCKNQWFFINKSHYHLNNLLIEQKINSRFDCSSGCESSCSSLQEINSDSELESEIEK